MADSKDLLPYSVPESGEQGDFALTTGQQPERVIDNSAPEDPPVSARLAQCMTEFAQIVRNLSVAELVTLLMVMARGIATILWEIPAENIKERAEMKEKLKEIKYNRMKEIGHYKCKLEEKIREAHKTDDFNISKVESDEWDWKLIETKDLVATCGFEITYLQALVSRLDSEARCSVRWITFQLITGLLVVFGMIYYHWVHAKETGETGTAVQSVPVGSVFMILGMAILFARKAREFSKSNKLAGECKEVKSKLDKTKLDYMKCKEAAEIKLPEQKKRFRVVDYDESANESLYRSLDGRKCKKD